jgi:hypothetical protein
MPLRKRKKPRDSQRISRGSTKTRARLKGTVRPGQVLTVVLCGVAGIVLALVWGNHLKAKSDAYRDKEALGDWTVDTAITDPLPVEVPDIRAVEIRPEGNVGDILMAGKADGVILPLCDGKGIPLYASAVGHAAGMVIPSDAPSLADDIARVSRRGLNVTVVYTVTCFSVDGTAESSLRRGLDLALLRECAEARPGDILLLGLPAGTDVSDRKTVEFLGDLNALLDDLPVRPAIGVALPPSVFASDSSERGDGFTQGNPSDTAETEAAKRPLYAEVISPARVLAACDYLAMDLRAMSAVGVATLLPDIQFPYVRYSLRLLVNKQDRDAVERTLERGYERVFEMEPPPLSEVTDGENDEP